MSYINLISDGYPTVYRSLIWKPPPHFGTATLPLGVFMMFPFCQNRKGKHPTDISNKTRESRAG